MSFTRKFQRRVARQEGKLWGLMMADLKQTAQRAAREKRRKERGA